MESEGVWEAEVTTVGLLLLGRWRGSAGRSSVGAIDVEESSSSLIALVLLQEAP